MYYGTYTGISVPLFVHVILDSQELFLSHTIKAIIDIHLFYLGDKL